MLATAASNIGGIGDLAGKRVAVIPGTTTEQALTAALQKALINARVVEVGEHAEGLAALEAGTVDAYVSDRVLLAGLLVQAKDPGKLRLGSQIFSYEPYALMMRRGDTGFSVWDTRSLRVPVEPGGHHSQPQAAGATTSAPRITASPTSRRSSTADSAAATLP